MKKRKASKNGKKSRQPSGAPRSFGKALGFSELTRLTAELQALRASPPEVTSTPGRREGDVLGFVRGLRLSAGLIYFLRERLSHTPFEVSWGHLLDEDEASCSPECDVIIHTKGHVRRWNGGDLPIMDFRFIPVSAAKAVVSCKSTLTSIDRRYPRQLKGFGVSNVMLFAERCDVAKFKSLERSAKSAGYRSLCCLYLTKDEEIVPDEKQYAKFVDSVLKAAK